MKRIILALLFAPLFAGAQTKVPVQLLNPAGSTAGQAIISTGPTTAPAFGAVPLTGITGTLPIANGGTGATTASAARTNLGLGTAAVANTGTSGATVPLLSATNTWTLGQAFTVRPTFNGATPWDSANLASPAQTTGATFTGAIVPSQTIGITGTTTTNNANAGAVGEYVTNSASGIALTNATSTNITSISLTAGDWDVRGVINFIPAATTVIQAYAASVNNVSATQGGLGFSANILSTVPAGNGNPQIATPVARFSLASTTTIFLVGTPFFSVSTMTGSGVIAARRVR